MKMYLALAVLLALPPGAGAQRGARFPRGGGRVGRNAPPVSRPAARPPLGTGLERLSQLPPSQRQQQVIKSLNRLNAMTPEQQQRTIQRMRDLGKLNPDQRAGLESVFNQFQGMTPDRRRAFRQAYNNLRQLPPEQRDLRMSQPGFQQRFSPDEIQGLHKALDLNLPSDVIGARPSGGL